jgi:hypothetical protein
MVLFVLSKIKDGHYHRTYFNIGPNGKINLVGDAGSWEPLVLITHPMKLVIL